jgi:GMP synthase-like glutamine amidotransferase
VRIHALQHAAIEDLGAIEEWGRERGHQISYTHLYRNEACPEVDAFDWLVVLGGPMSVHEEERYPWLREEKTLIRRAVEVGKTLLGICLGAQLLAEVLGSPVTRNRYEEIGWFPVTLTEDGERSPLFGGFPKTFMALHWHGDTFELPEGCQRVAESEGCANQAFVYGDRLVGLQFHLEATRQTLQKWFGAPEAEQKTGRYIQDRMEVLSQERYLPECQRNLNLLLSALEERSGR